MPRVLAPASRPAGPGSARGTTHPLVGGRRRPALRRGRCSNASSAGKSQPPSERRPLDEDDLDKTTMEDMEEDRYHQKNHSYQQSRKRSATHLGASTDAGLCHEDVAPGDYLHDDDDDRLPQHDETHPNPPSRSLSNPSSFSHATATTTLSWPKPRQALAFDTRGIVVISTPPSPVHPSSSSSPSTAIGVPTTIHNNVLESLCQDYQQFGQGLIHDRGCLPRVVVVTATLSTTTSSSAGAPRVGIPLLTWSPSPGPAGSDLVLPPLVVKPCPVFTTASSSASLSSSSSSAAAAAAAPSSTAIEPPNEKKMEDKRDEREEAEAEMMEPPPGPTVTLSVPTGGPPGPATLPALLTASASWQLLQQMVDEIRSHPDDPDEKPTPWQVTVVVSDASFFGQPVPEIHLAGLKKWIQHLQEKAASSSSSAPIVGALHLVVVKTHTLGLAPPTARHHHRDPVPQESNGTATVTEEVTADQARDSIGRSHHQLKDQDRYEQALQACLDLLQAHMEEMDLVVEKNHLTAPLHLSMSVVEWNPVSFLCLTRRWVRESLQLVQQAAGRSTSLSGPFRLELPETLDGTQCTVALEAYYAVFPFPVHHLHARQLQSDLWHLAESKMEVLQIIPLASIDLSLMFGVPLTVRSGMQETYEQYQEMEALVRALFQLLQDRQAALLLRSSLSSSGGSNKSLLDPGIFHSSLQPTHLFLLMAQELPLAVRQPPPTGLLFRYAQAEHLLHEAVPTPNSPVGQQYMEYMEEVLAILPCAAFNPLDPPPSGKTEPKDQCIPPQGIPMTRDHGLVTPRLEELAMGPESAFIPSVSLSSTQPEDAVSQHGWLDETEYEMGTFEYE